MAEPNILPEAADALNESGVDAANLIALHRIVTTGQQPRGPYDLVRSVHGLATGVRIAVCTEPTGQISIVLAE